MNNIFLVNTENSSYEIDLDGQKIRRVRGSAAPTEHQKNDLGWQKYKDITELKIGQSLFIVWDFVEESGQMRAKSTATSPLVSIKAIDTGLTNN